MAHRRILFYPSERKSGDAFTDTLSYEKLPKSRNQYNKLFYCTENTLPGSEAQINKLSTGIVFKGTFTVDGVNVENLYYYKPVKERSEIYTSLEQLRQALEKKELLLCPIRQQIRIWQPTV